MHSAGTAKAELGYLPAELVAVVGSARNLLASAGAKLVSAATNFDIETYHFATSPHFGLHHFGAVAGTVASAQGDHEGAADGTAPGPAELASWLAHAGRIDPEEEVLAAAAERAAAPGADLSTFLVAAGIALAFVPVRFPAFAPRVSLGAFSQCVRVH